MVCQQLLLLRGQQVSPSRGPLLVRRESIPLGRQLLQRAPLLLPGLSCGRLRRHTSLLGLQPLPLVVRQRRPAGPPLPLLVHIGRRHE